MQVWIRVFAVAACPATGGAIAYAHSWYPKECCSQFDCVPADQIEMGTSGIAVVVVGRQRIAIPPGFVTRSSPDGHIQVCFVASPEEGVPPTPLCLFVPGQA
jgi:hypothetical protein